MFHPGGKCLGRPRQIPRSDVFRASTRTAAPPNHIPEKIALVERLTEHSQNQENCYVPISTVHQSAQLGFETATRPRPPAIGMLSTYPPTQCGLATFSAALIQHLQLGSGALGVVRVVDDPELRPGPDVVAHLVNGSDGQRGRRRPSPQPLRRGRRPTRVRHLRRSRRRRRPADRGCADRADDHRAAHRSPGSDAAAAAHPASAPRRGRRRRDDDPHRQQAPGRELRRRPGAGRRHPARRGRPRARRPRGAPTCRPSARPDLGI